MHGVWRCAGCREHGWEGARLARNAPRRVAIAIKPFWPRIILRRGPCLQVTCYNADITIALQHLCTCESPQSSSLFAEYNIAQTQRGICSE